VPVWRVQAQEAIGLACMDVLPDKLAAWLA
jgi:hypothetical protein